MCNEKQDEVLILQLRCQNLGTSDFLEKTGDKTQFLTHLEISGYLKLQILQNRQIFSTVGKLLEIFPKKISKTRNVLLSELRDFQVFSSEFQQLILKISEFLFAIFQLFKLRDFQVSSRKFLR